MKHSRILALSITAAVLVYALLCFVTVFSVSDVTTEYSIYQESEVSKAEEILSSYRGKNLVFINTEEIERRILEETSLKVLEIKKVYPFTLKASFFARQERFAVQREDGSYYILDDEYTVLHTRDTLVNPSDNLSDILIRFTVSDTVTLREKSTLSISDQALYDGLKTVVSAFSSPRDVIESLDIFQMPEEGNYRLNLRMRSGVTVEVYKFTSRTAEKISRGIAKYNALTDGDKLSGTINCYEKDSGEVVAVYTR